MSLSRPLWLLNGSPDSFLTSHVVQFFSFFYVSMWRGTFFNHYVHKILTLDNRFLPQNLQYNLHDSRERALKVSLCIDISQIYMKMCFGVLNKRSGKLRETILALKFVISFGGFLSLLKKTIYRSTP